MGTDQTQQLIRRIRRAALEARTISVTLHSSLATLGEIPDSSAERAADLRREWIRRVTPQLAAVRALIDANREVARALADRESRGRHDRGAEIEDALRRAEGELAQAEVELGRTSEGR